MREILVVIPARFRSTRLPGKPLADLAGKSVIQRCIEQCLQAVDSDAVVVATDDERIREHCLSLGVHVDMTSPDCLTGTDRVAEVAAHRPAQWYVNVQGDEPFLDPRALELMIETCRNVREEVSVVNAYSPISEESEFRSVTVPKVVTREDGRLQYISRAPIPTTKNLEFVSAMRQVGMYAFRASALEAYAAVGAKGFYESMEDIEILRFLDLNIDVLMVEIEASGIAIDTPEDLRRAHDLIQKS